jgi:hypothetical protein
MLIESCGRKTFEKMMKKNFTTEFSFRFEEKKVYVFQPLLVQEVKHLNILIPHAEKKLLRFFVDTRQEGNYVECVINCELLIRRVDHLKHV